MYLILGIILILAITIIIIKQAKFGKTPKEKRLERIMKSPNYKNGAFQNQSNTPQFTEGSNIMKVMKEFMFGNNKHKSPIDNIPSKKINLLNLNPNEDLLVWFGHSSYFMQIDGKSILVDPVFSGHASPFAFSIKSFKGADVYSAADFPALDYLFITHDHWDHLDYPTIIELKPKIKHIVTGLGTGEHFEHWNFDVNKITELDWYETTELAPGFKVSATPSRHFSGRGYKRNKAIWVSFVLETPSMKFFLGGDSGYDKHFVEIGKKYGPFDLAILENGQYNQNWKYIHMTPAEGIQAAYDLNTTKHLPVHSAKFALANHNWDTPLKDIYALSKKTNIELITPIIGEAVVLKNSDQTFKPWWEEIK